MVLKLQAYSSLQAWIYDHIIADAVTQRCATMLDPIIASLPVKASVLDVGCGGGQIALRLAQQRPDLRITAVDLSAAQIRRAQRRDQSSGSSVEFRQADALQLPFSDSSFDLVYSIASLKHWPCPIQGLKECCRTLRTGGQLAVAEADRECRPEDASEYVADWHVPRLLRPLALRFFRRVVLNQSLNPAEAETLVRELPLGEIEIGPIPKMPALLLKGRKYDPSDKQGS